MTALARATCALALMATLASAATQKSTNDESGKKLRRQLPAATATATTHLSSSSDSSSKSLKTTSKSSKSSTKSSKGGRRKKRDGRYDRHNRPEKKPSPVPRNDGNVDSTPSVGGNGDSTPSDDNGDSKPGNGDSTPSVGGNGDSTSSDDNGDSKPGNGDSTPSVPHVKGCIDKARYYEIDADIQEIASQIDDDKDRSHFYGGILRLAAHDFMDYDQNADDKMGMDGCIDWTSLSNAGLNSIWHESAELYKLYESKHSDTLSRADFWVMAANAVVRQTSVGPGLDLIDTFYYGRKDRDQCEDSDERLPTTEGCRQVEGVFLERMGLTWKDAVALLGAHTLGRGHTEFSGHHGTWVPNDIEAQVFNKLYFQELVGRSWTRRIMSDDPLFQDWTTGHDEPEHKHSPKMMLNTDICLVWDVEDHFDRCCTRTDLLDNDGNSHCQEAADNQCDLYDNGHPRMGAVDAVMEFLGDADDNNDNAHFYEAFKIAWLKATVNGMHELHPLRESCSSEADA